MFLKIAFCSIAFIVFSVIALVMLDVYNGAMEDANKDWEDKHDDDN